jgi:hypothetical protein
MITAKELNSISTEAMNHRDEEHAKAELEALDVLLREKAETGLFCITVDQLSRFTITYLRQFGYAVEYRGIRGDYQISWNV